MAQFEPESAGNAALLSPSNWRLIGDSSSGVSLTARPPLIQLEGVTKSFDGGRSFAVDQVSLTFTAGSLVAVVGASGSGKTTLLKTINRLVEPDAGRVLVEGNPVAGQAPAALRRRIGYVFQGIGLFPHLRVAENIAITPRLLAWPEAEIAPRIDELLDLVALPRDFAVRYPDALSGGQRQRVGVARALAAKPSMVLMDEPFGALDPLTRDGLATAYRALHDRLGLTTVMVTHDIQEAVLMADRIVVMAQGRVLADGAPAALMAQGTDPAVAELMDMPRRQAERVQALIKGAAP
jgi:osmoprotectant transport system ATP-binding protein